MLAAMGMGSGGVLKIGSTAVLVRPRAVGEPTALELGDRAIANAGIELGSSVDAQRGLLVQALRVAIGGDVLALDARTLLRALQGQPISAGDHVQIDPKYLKGDKPVTFDVVDVEPGPSALIGTATSFVSESDVAAGGAIETLVRGTPSETSAALIAGLETELYVLTGWLSLLTSPRDLPNTWGLPEVAGVILEGPSGVGTLELVRTAAETAGATLHEVNLASCSSRTDSSICSKRQRNRPLRLALSSSTASKR